MIEMKEVAMLHRTMTCGSYVLLIVASFINCAQATWKPEYAQVAPEVRKWYHDQQMTPEAYERIHKDNNGTWKSCCEHGDVFRTQFRIIEDGSKYGHETWWYLKGDTWRQIPDDVIHWGEHAPDKRPTLFLYQNTGEELCFYPGDVDG